MHKEQVWYERMYKCTERHNRSVGLKPERRQRRWRQISDIAAHVRRLRGAKRKVLG